MPDPHDTDQELSRLCQPVEYLPGDPEPEEGLALCLSGGGYRAMLFHVGSLWRLYETGILAKLDRISSVSGGSITAAVLGLNWDRLKPAEPYDRAWYEDLVVRPIRSLAGETIDAWDVIGGLILPGSINEFIQESYRKHLFGHATLQDLPLEPPRFVINATNLQSGVLWRFSRKYMWDYRVGKVEYPRVSLAAAVGASSAYPPVLSPMILEMDPGDFAPGTGQDLQREPYTSRAVLSDGGVYDNLGLETAWKRYQTVFVSNAGGKLQPQEEPRRDWARQAIRVVDVIDNQVRSLRVRNLIRSYQVGDRQGAYWGIGTNIANYQLPDALPCPLKRTLDLAETPTRLKRLDAERQERLINWGYAVCDAGLRKHYDTTLAAPGDFPYPAAAV